MTRTGYVMAGIVTLAAFLNTAPLSAGDNVDQKARELLGRMTQQEKIGQLYLLNNGADDADVRAGCFGAFLNVTDPSVSDHMQRVAVEKSRLGIPLLFGRDVIHGLRTIYPIPLGQACTWDEALVREAAAASASEAAAAGYNWTFSPMVDISRDPRWGRIAESFGEDPLLASRMAVAVVKGYQTPQPGLPVGIAACVKHFAAYGAAEGGRDYNTTLVPPRELRDVYLRPYEAAAKAGAYSFMSAFNDLDGVPCTGNRWLLTDVLRQDWGFEGFVVSDWRSTSEMLVHGFAADEREAAKRSIDAGLDMEMVGRSYVEQLPGLIESGEVDAATLDERVLAVLRTKLRMGLFEHPYREQGREGAILSAEHLNLALKTALESAVLLKNDSRLLPLAAGTTVAVIGPLADAPHEQIGTWAFDSHDADSRTPLAALRGKLGKDKVIYAPGLKYSRDESREGFAAAVKAASNADVALIFAGEEAMLSGEAHCRADLRLPGAQEALIKAVAATGKPVVLVIMSGRPIVITGVKGNAQAVLAAFHQGTMTGPALAELIFGDVSPSGRLPVTWPADVGQIPLYYNHKNTGRPSISKDFVPISQLPRRLRQSSLGNTSAYLDVQPGPAYPFGYGLTYGRFEYSDLALNAATMPVDGELLVSATLTNTGKRAATEVVQLYVRDLVGSVTRPVRELKDFTRVTLAPGQSQRVSFTLKAADLNFTDIDMHRIVEPGAFKLWVAPNSQEGLETSFEVTP